MIILGLGRIAGLPVFISVVASGSMAPALQPLDMVVALRKSCGVGDIVIWCSAPMYCVIHRVAEVRGDMVITKGDANPAPDPPVGLGLVRGVAVLTIPRSAWISLVLLSSAIYIALKIRRRPGATGFSRGSVAAYAVVIFYSIFIALLAISSPISPVLFTGLSIPSAELVEASFDGDRGSVYIRYNLGDLEIMSINGCTLIAGNTSISCSPRALGGFLETLEISLPSDVLRLLNLRVLT